MLVYCMKCESANEEDEAFCVACKNPLKAIPVPPKTAPWKRTKLPPVRVVPGYRFLEVLAVVVGIFGMLHIVPLPVCCILHFVSPAATAEFSLPVWLVLVSVFVSGVIIMGFSELLNCVRDIARNSFR